MVFISVVSSFQNLLEQEVFHQTLLACCIEIAIFSYNAPQRTFPWILEALNVEPYYFYKVIEPIVRAEEQLSRDMIKHLNLVSTVYSFIYLFLVSFSA